jgi:hypothetical protein
MNVLDENIPESQRELLRGWGIRVRQIGIELGHKGLQDREILPLLHQLSRPTFFTRDTGFYDRTACHPRYSLVCLAVGEYEAASFIRRLLRHASFRTWAQRRGAVLRVSRAGIRLWRLHEEVEEAASWPQ